MILFNRAYEISQYLEKIRTKDLIIGFVPTMGALHKGHLSLLNRSKELSKLTVATIFVNPTQFNDASDLSNYPRPIERDIEMLTNSGCDVLFLPEVEDIYPEGTQHLKHFDLGNLETFLEGKLRPGHFQGVANVIDRFLQILKPDLMFLGQKDFQQIKVLEQIVRSEGYQTSIIICPIVREENGLAMSSRNVRLTPVQRENASGISKALYWIRDHFKEFSLSDLKAKAIEQINLIPETRVDYLEFCDTESFQAIKDLNEVEQAVVVTAVKVGNTRLLDNILLNN